MTDIAAEWAALREAITRLGDEMERLKHEQADAVAGMKAQCLEVAVREQLRYLSMLEHPETIPFYGTGSTMNDGRLRDDVIVAERTAARIVKAIEAIK